MNNNDWPFDQPENCAVFTIRQIVEKEIPILYAYHDLDDHGWQFLSDIETKMEDAKIVGLKEIVNLDPSVLHVAHMEPGFHAKRSSLNDSWIIEKTI